MENQTQTAEAWAEITIKEWQAKLGKQKIGSTQQLLHSFQQHVTAAAGGDLMRIELAYRLYGMFVDMGVGKGTGIEDVSENASERRLLGSSRGNRRRPKRWNSRILARNTKRLGEILAEKYGSAAIHKVVENLPETLPIL